MSSKFVKLHEIQEHCEPTMLAIRKNKIESVYTEDGETHVETEDSEFVVEESVDAVISQLDEDDEWD